MSLGVPKAMWTLVEGRKPQSGEIARANMMTFSSHDARKHGGGLQPFAHCRMEE